MGLDVAKVLRTAQNYIPFCKEAKDAGYRFARRLSRRPHEADFHVLARLRCEPGEVLVDVGANHGQTIESMRLCGPRTTIVAFEANPALAQGLRRLYRASPDVRIESCGLSDRAGRFTLYVPRYNGFVYDGLASLDRTSAETWLGPATLYGFDRRNLWIADVECRVETLDAFDLRPAFIKIDVQGLEREVLQGALRTIEQHQPALLIEDYAGDAALADLVRSLDYSAFHVADRSIVRGVRTTCNTLLLPTKRRRFDL